MPLPRPHRSVLIALLGLSGPAFLYAQPADTTRPVPARTPQLEFSGIIFANYQYRTAPQAVRSQNTFDVERAYLTFRMPAGNRLSIRITADVFQQLAAPGDAFYRGWAFRAKYAYLQYDFLRRPATAASALARIGMLHTVVIEHQETFWPRWISRTATELSGFFSSADLGVATLVTLPNRWGEVYLTATNGPGYTSREVDRFKDFAGRLSITPFSSGSGILKTATLTGWGYKGAIASRFVTGGAGQIGPVAEGLQRDRYGVFAGIRDRRLTVAAEVAQGMEEGELGNNTTASPRVLTDSTGRLLSAFAIVRPFELADSAAGIPLGLLLRWDRFTFNTDRDARRQSVIAGLLWDLSSRVSMALDYQEQLPQEGAPGLPTKTWFAHVVASF